MPAPAQSTSAVPPPTLYVEASPTARLQAVVRFMAAARARGEGICLLRCTDAPGWHEDLQDALPPPERLHVLDYTQPSIASGHPSSATGMVQWLCAALDVQPDDGGARMLAWMAMVATRFARLRPPPPLHAVAGPVCPDLLTMLGSPVPHKDWWQRTQGTLGAGWRSAVACHAALPHGFAARLSDLRHALGHVPAHAFQASEDLGAWLDAGDTVILRTQAVPSAPATSSPSPSPAPTRDAPISAHPIPSHPASALPTSTQDPSVQVPPSLPAPRIHVRLAMARLQQALTERCAAPLADPAPDAHLRAHRWSVVFLDTPADLGPSAPMVPAQARSLGVTVMQAAGPGFLDEASVTARAWRANFHFLEMGREQATQTAIQRPAARDTFHP